MADQADDHRSRAASGLGNLNIRFLRRQTVAESDGCHKLTDMNRREKLPVKVLIEPHLPEITAEIVIRLPSQKLRQCLTVRK